MFGHRKVDRSMNTIPSRIMEKLHAQPCIYRKSTVAGGGIRRGEDALCGGQERYAWRVAPTACRPTPEGRGRARVGWPQSERLPHRGIVKQGEVSVACLSIAASAIAASTGSVVNRTHCTDGWTVNAGLCTFASRARFCRVRRGVTPVSRVRGKRINKRRQLCGTSHSTEYA